MSCSGPRRRGGLLAAGALVVIAPLAACSGGYSPPRNLHVSVAFATPADGAVVHDPFEVRLAVQGLTLHSANGDQSGKTGHVVFFIDTQPPPAWTRIPKAQGVLRTPKDAITFRRMPPGRHVIVAVLADGKNHRLGDGEAVVHIDVVSSPGGVSPTTAPGGTTTTAAPSASG